MKVKRKALQTDAEALSTAADDFRLSREIAATNTCVKSKQYVKSRREKAEQLNELNQLIDNKLLELENCP